MDAKDRQMLDVLKEDCLMDIQEVDWLIKLEEEGKLSVEERTKALKEINDRQLERERMILDIKRRNP